MSSLPDTNGGEARELFKEAMSTYEIAVWSRSRGKDHRKVAARNFVHAAELALKSIYVNQERPFLRTHQIDVLYQDCPRPDSAPIPLFTTPELEEFSKWYLSPYWAAKPIAEADLRKCEDISTRIVLWAKGVIDRP